MQSAGQPCHGPREGEVFPASVVFGDDPADVPVEMNATGSFGAHRRRRASPILLRCGLRRIPHSCYDRNSRTPPAGAGDVTSRTVGKRLWEPLTLGSPILLRFAPPPLLPGPAPILLRWRADNPTRSAPGARSCRFPKSVTVMGRTAPLHEKDGVPPSPNPLPMRPIPVTRRPKSVTNRPQDPSPRAGSRSRKEL
jgi:hypothetical protein